MKLRVTIVLILSLMWGVYSWEWYTCRIKGLCNIETIVAEVIPASKTQLASIRDNLVTLIDNVLADNSDNDDIANSYDVANNTATDSDSKEDIIDGLDESNFSEPTIDQGELSTKIKESIEVNENILDTDTDTIESDDELIPQPVAANAGIVNKPKPVIIPPTQTLDVESENDTLQIDAPIIDEPEVDIALESFDEFEAKNTDEIEFSMEIISESEIKGSPELNDIAELEVSTESIIEPEVEIAEPKALEVEELQTEPGQIHFPYRNHSRPLLSADINTYLSNLVVMLSSGNQVHLIGHTDGIGNDIKNHNLGLKRAQMIQQILIDRGAPADSITIESKGKLNPIEDNDTEIGREINRRVEIIITP